jgi:hypothetical protein
VIVVVQPHAGPDDVKNIDDPKWPIAFVRAKLAMVNMIDGNQRINTGSRSGF